MSDIDLEQRFAEANREWDAGHTARAFKLFYASANAGYNYAFNSLGYFYDEGLGTRRNLSRAMYWYRRAARTGDTCALSNLAATYNRLGNRTLAKRWLQKAVDRGDGDAALELAKMHLGGKPKKRSDSLAKKYLRIAIATKSTTPAGRAEAQRLLTQL